METSGSGSPQGSLQFSVDTPACGLRSCHVPGRTHSAGENAPDS